MRTFSVACIVLTSMMKLVSVRGASQFTVDIALPGYFGFDSFTSLLYIGPAFDSGMAYLRRTYPYINWTSTYLAADGKTCADELTYVQNLLAEWYYRKKEEKSDLQLIMTGGCRDVEALNQLAASWNIPMITSSGTPVFDSLQLRAAASRKYPTLLTTSFFATNYAELYFELFRSFKWTTLYFITDTSAPNVYSFISNKVSSSTRNRLDSTVYTTSYSSAVSPLDFDLELRKVQDVSRVILLFSGPAELRRFLLCASKRNMTSGEYMFDDDTYYHWKTDQADDEIVRESYRSVLMMHIVEVDNDTISGAQTLRSEWEERSRRQYNSTKLVMPWLTSAYQAMQLLGKVLDKTLSMNTPFNYSDGIAFTAPFRNRTFDLDLGDLTVNSLGQRAAKLGFRFFSAISGRFELFMMSYEEANRVIWRNIRRPVWFDKNSLPSNEPYCGFRNQKPVCRAASMNTAAIIGCLIFLVLILCLFSFLWNRRRAQDMDLLWKEWLLTDGLVLQKKRNFAQMNTESLWLLARFPSFRDDFPDF